MTEQPPFYRILTGAFLSGIFIGIAGTVYLAVPNAVAGAFLFGFGLMTIVCCGYKLYTGAIGYLAVQTRTTLLPYLAALFWIWTGNLAGCYTVGFLVRNSRTDGKLAARAAAVCAEKLHDSPSSLLILSFFCGILMYTAVETYRRKELHAAFRLASVFLCVAVFILSGFEHCVANMYYFSVAGVWSVNTLLAVLLMTLGNSLGGMFVPTLDRFR